MDELIGKNIGPYTVAEKLGEGGMAVVYKGYQQSLNRYVAIKVLRGELARDQEFINRFRREALAVARLSHPNILHVYDAGSAQGMYYIVMDYVDGGSLKDLIERGSLDTERTISIVAQLADALDYAHRQGLVHRDVKPSNVLMTRDGRPLLTDFGIAKVLHESTHLTRTGTSIGTPEYMSPEQLQGQVIDGRTDIYSLGIVLFEMLAGWTPFSAPTPMATMYKQMNEPPPPLRQVNITIPAWLEGVVDKALAKQPEARFRQASDMAEALRHPPAPEVAATAARPRGGAAQAMPATARAATPPRQAQARRQKSPVPILLGAIFLLLLVLVGGGVYALLGGGFGSATPLPPTAIVVVASPAATQPLEPTQAATATPVAPPSAAPDTPTSVVVVVTSTPPPTSPAEPTSPPEPTPLPTAIPTSPPEPTVAPTTAPTIAPPAAPTKAPTKAPTPSGEPGVITDFENFGTWKRGDQANGTFTQSGAQAHQGSYSGKLDYSFPTAGNDYVVFEQSHAIAGQPTRITAWVYGDGAGHFLNVWIKDKGGEVWQVPLGTVTHSGWQQMVGALDVNQAWPWAHISGPDDGTIDYPISFVGLVLDDKPDTYTGSGTIYIDDLRADTGTASTNPSPTKQVAAQPTSQPSGGIAVSGRIAYSAGGALHIVDAQSGKDTVGPIPNMRQPDFQSGGNLIIVNGEGGGTDSLWTVANGSLQREQSTHPDDFYPFFSPTNGSRFVYDSTMMGKGDHNLFVGNLDKRREARDPLSFGGGLIIGSHPVWLPNDMLVYTGCDYGFGSGSNCGLFLVPSWGGQPKRIVAGGLTDYATDAAGSQVLFTSQRDGNFELYIVNADGSGLRNLSNSAGSNDGLGTFSPDGKLVAFVSNRAGNWAIWVVRPDGSGLTKLFNLPAKPTGTWNEERITWGP